MRIAWLVALAACGTSAPATSTAPTASAPPAAPTASAPAPPPVEAKPSISYPPAAREPVTDHYGDVDVVDNYRWLENAKDPRVIAWTAAQNALTRQRLDAAPDRTKIHARVSELLSTRAPHYDGVTVIGSGVLALKFQPPKQQAMLVALGDPADAATERIVLDPNALDPSGHTEIDFFVPSRDGKRVGVSLSTGGSERGDLHIYDVATGKALPDALPHVNGGTAGGSIAWNADGSGLWYTRYPHPGERPDADLDFYQQVYFHKLGTPESADRYVLGKDLPKIAEIALLTSFDGQSVLVSVANGDGGEFAFYALDSAGRIAPLFAFADHVVHGKFGADGALYFDSRKDAPNGSVIRLARPFATSKPTVVVPEGEGSIDLYAATASRLYIAELVGGPSRLRSYRLADGKASAPEVIATPPISAIYRLRQTGTDDVLYAAQSYTTTPGWYRYSPTSQRSTATALVQPMAFSMDDVEVVRTTCTSADGTAVPLNILHRKGIALDGSHPALLTGYGGYSIPMTPRLHPLSRLWIDQGGVFAEANLRGGNELGEAWHKAGMLTSKQHVFDDFYACEKALVTAGYSSPDHLAIEGGSNGGLLMGAMLTQHPEMARVVVSHVGIYDVLRTELTPNGAFNVPEYGTVKDPAQFRAMYAYSPYHHVTDGTAYPAILFTTGANDPRVDPYNSRKMTARLQAASSSSHPIMLRASADVGHGIGSPLGAVIEESTDVYAFLMSELNMHFTSAP